MRAHEFWIASKIPIHERSPWLDSDHDESLPIDLDSSDCPGVRFRIIMDPYDDSGRSSLVTPPVRLGLPSVSA